MAFPGNSRLEARFFALLERFGAPSVRTDSAGVLTNDGAGNLSWAAGGGGGSGIFDYGLVTDATTVPQDFGSVP